MGISKRWCDHRHLSGKHRSISYHSCLSRDKHLSVTLRLKRCQLGYHGNSPFRSCFRVLSIQSVFLLPGQTVMLSFYNNAMRWYTTQHPVTPMASANHRYRSSFQSKCDVLFNIQIMQWGCIYDI